MQKQLNVGGVLKTTNKHPHKMFDDLHAKNNLHKHVFMCSLKVQQAQIKPFHIKKRKLYLIIGAHLERVKNKLYNRYLNGFLISLAKIFCEKLLFLAF